MAGTPGNANELDETQQTPLPLQHSLVGRSAKRSLFADEAENEQSKMHLLRVLTHEAPDFNRGSGPASVLRDFAHTNHLYMPSLSLTLQRVLVVGVRSFLLLLSDAFSSVWAVAVDDPQTMDLVFQYRTALRGTQVQVVLHKCMMRDCAAFLLATNVRVEGAESEEDIANYLNDAGDLLPGSHFGQPAVRHGEGAVAGAPPPPEPVRKWQMLVCNGPRVDVFSGGAAAEEYLVSFISECIPRLVRKSSFDARLSVLRVDESQVLLTDGTHSLMARFADGLVFRDGVFRASGQRSPRLEVGDVLDVHALGYAHATHIRMQPRFEFYPTCLVTRCVQQLGRDVGGRRVERLVAEAARAKQEQRASEPRVEPWPAHAVTRSKNQKRQVSVSAFGAFCAAGALASAQSHRDAMARAMQTALTALCEEDDILLLVSEVLLPREVSMLMRVNKKMLCRLHAMYMPSGAEGAGIGPELLLASRVMKRVGALSMRRARVLMHSYHRLAERQLLVSLGAASGGLALYQTQSSPRRFSIERVFGSFMAENMDSCRCVVPAKVNKKQPMWRSRQHVRCALCAVARERTRWVWRLGADNLDAAAPWEDIKTFRRVQMGVRHRFLFREDVARWAAVDNMRRLVRMFASPALQDSEQFPRYTVEYGQKCGAPRTHRLPAVRQLTNANGSALLLDLPGCRATLRKLLRVFPLTPGALLWLHEETMGEARRIWHAWGQSPLSTLEAEETLHVRCFLPAPVEERPRVRIVLQVCGLLMHNARALHVQRGNSSSECCLHLDDDFVSFRAHDGRNEMMFSTECQSFMRLLDQALVAQELDADYQRRSGLARVEDEMRVFVGGGEANVLADYVVAFSVHEVEDVAQLCWLDLFSDDETSPSVVYEMRAFDFEVLDTKMPPSYMDDMPDSVRRQNYLGCSALVSDMREQNESMLEDDDLVRRQTRRRSGLMESEDEDDYANEDPQTPLPLIATDSEDDEEATQSYSPTTPQSP